MTSELPSDFFKKECKEGRGGWSKEELQKFCIAYNLQKTGNKKELCDRLTAFLKKSTVVTQTTQLPVELEIIIFKRLNTLADIIQYANSDRYKQQIFNTHKKQILLENPRLKENDFFNWILIQLEHNKIQELINTLKDLKTHKDNRLVQFIENKNEPVRMNLYKITKTKNDTLINHAFDFYTKYFLGERFFDKFKKKIRQHRYNYIDLKDLLTWVSLLEKRYNFEYRNDILNFNYPKDFLRQIYDTNDREMLDMFLKIIFRSSYLKTIFRSQLRLLSELEKSPRSTLVRRYFEKLQAQEKRDREYMKQRRQIALARSRRN